MEVFQEMVHKGCERSVITYSSLISACEKAGQWELALELFNEMAGEGCVPNTVTFNSLITACAQGERTDAHHQICVLKSKNGPSSRSCWLLCMFPAGPLGPMLK